MREGTSDDDDSHKKNNNTIQQTWFDQIESTMYQSKYQKKKKKL